MDNVISHGPAVLRKWLLYLFHNLHPLQKTSFNPNWIWRESILVLVITP